MANCNICSHTYRAAIENAVLNLPTPIQTKDLEVIASTYSISVNDLKIHMVAHATMGLTTMSTDEVPTEETPSLARRCKLKEADMLAQVANEYMVTLKNIGRRINSHVNDDEVRIEKMITKPITDLYLGMGSEIRQTVKSMSELDQQLNGPKESNKSAGLAALAGVIQASQMIADGRLKYNADSDEYTPTSLNVPET